MSANTAFSHFNIAFPSQFILIFLNYIPFVSVGNIRNVRQMLAHSLHFDKLRLIYIEDAKYIWRH